MIESKKLDWNGELIPLTYQDIEHIVIHHTASNSTFEEIHRYHKSKGWVGIGYNFFIEKDGTIKEGRGLNVGAGATGYNFNSLHICFNGNFENEEPTKEQIKSGKWLINHLLSFCNAKVLGHKDVANTLCPGKRFPLKEFKEMRKMTKEEQIKLIQEKAGIDDNSIQYLEFYRYGKELIEKLANAMI